MNNKRRSNRFTDLPFAGRYTIPSGVVTTTPSVIARIARDVPEIGFLTSKTVSVTPRTGYREPVLHEYHPGCFVNAVGLANPGAEAFAAGIKPLLPLHGGKPLIVSIMGETPDEFLRCAEILEPVADAFELNLSCPHVKGAGQSVGSDPEMTRTIIRMIKDRFRTPIIPKLSPNLPDIGGMALLCQEAGADALCLVNTLGPGMATDARGNPILSNVYGGMSGDAIRPAGLKAVREASGKTALPIIAAGGIRCAADVVAYSAAGASYFGIGSALAGMNTPEIAHYFRSLQMELSEIGEDRPVGARKPACACTRTDYMETTVRENIHVSEHMFQLTLNEGPQCAPGRFFFLRIPGVGEKPFSPFSDSPPGFLIRAVGPFTSALEALKPGDSLWLRGPYGNGFPPAQNAVLVGGGTGVAPLLMFAESASPVGPCFFGFSEEIAPALRERLARVGSVVIDPPGKPGEALRALDSLLRESPGLFDDAHVYVCGPAAMMNAAVRLLHGIIPESRILLSREDVMRCGIGVCGSCGTPSGLRSCVDGPALNPGM